MEIEPKQKLTVDYDPISQRFLVDCPFWDNAIVEPLSNKRWSKVKRKWSIPLTRNNVQHIAEHMRDTGVAGFSEKAHNVLDETLLKISNMGKGGGFPAWYPYKTKPRNHQVKCLEKWYGLEGFACFMDRGTGKTKTTIDMACALRMEGKIDALIVCCKLSGRRNWKEEWEIHGTVDASFHFPTTTKLKEYDAWLSNKHELPVIVIGIESLSAGNMAKLMNSFAMSHINVMMAIDESHMISNHKAIRTMACIAMRYKTKYRVTLTGTPISTGPLNLYSQFEFLDPDIIGVGDFYSFRNRYAVMGGYRDKRTGKPMQVVGYQNIDELTRTVAPYTFECRKSDVLDLPPKIFEKAYVELTKEQRVLYDKVKKEQSYEWGGKEVTIENVLGVALRLHQITGGYVTTYTEVEGPNGKIKKVPEVHEIIPPSRNPKVLEMLEYAADMVPMIVWCAYRAEIGACVAALKEAYPEVGVGEIHGGIDEVGRNKAKDDFQAGRIMWLVGNTTTGGSSLTLTKCEIMFYFNNTEKMIDREQSEDRAHRDGLKHSVLYIDCVAEKTVDVSIMKSLTLKVNLSDYIRDNIAQANKILAGEI